MKVDEIRRIAVVGSGLMGYQIGMEFALAGYEVCLNDLIEEKLQQALKNIQADLQKFMDLGLLTFDQVEPVMSRIHTTPVLEDAVKDVDVVFESVFEDLELKQRIFRELDKLCPERTILVSNASGLPPSELASATNRPDRVLVANYWNPTFLLPHIDMVRGDETSDETVETIYNLLTKVGKKPVIENEPGYVGNRLQRALREEAFSIVRNGIATPQDVDTAIKNGLGRRYAFVGILEYFDYLSLDSEMADQKMKEWFQNRTIDRMRKTGKGFYEWTPDSFEIFKKRLGKALVEISKIHGSIE